METFVTVSGKPMTVPASFRIGMVEYLKILELARKKNKTLSSLTQELWLRELTKNEGAKNGR